MPDLKSKRVAREFTLGRYSCIVCTDCVSNQRTDYKHVMYVHREGDQAPCFAVAAETLVVADEVKAMLARMRAERADPAMIAASAALAGSHVLGVFPGEGHENHGSSDEWADLDKFTAQALAIVSSRFEITKPPLERAPDASRVTPPGHARSPSPRSKGTPRPAKSWWQFWK